MKKYTLIILLFCTKAHSQKELNMIGDYGYATITGYNIKKITLNRGLIANLELKLNYDWHYTCGLGMNQLEYSSTDTAGFSRFNTITFLNAPLTIKKYYTVNRNSTSFAFIEGGVILNHFFKQKEEIRTNGQTISAGHKSIGTNIDIIIGIAFKTVMTRNIFFNVGIYNTGNMLKFYKNKSDELSTKSTILKMGITLVF